MPDKIGFVVDSTADFPDGVVKQLGLHVIPIHIFVDGNDFLHGVNISNADVIDHLKNRLEIKTAPPLPSEYSDLYEKLFIDKKYDKIISLHVSKHLSNCYTSAKNSLSLLDDKMSKKIILIDTKTATVGQALVAKRAVQIAKKYLIADMLERNINKYMQHCLVLFTVDNLYWLKRSGKTNMFSAFIGSSLDIKPIVGLKDGELYQLEKHMGIKTSIEEMANIAARSLEKYQNISNIWIAHADATANAIYLQEKLNEVIKCPINDFQLIDMGPTISAHTGPGAVCLAAMPGGL